MCIFVYVYKLVWKVINGYCLCGTDINDLVKSANSAVKLSLIIIWPIVGIFRYILVDKSDVSSVVI